MARMRVRAMNFGAGPGCMPQSVLEAAAAELLDFEGTGVSILETSHRSPVYMRVHDDVQTRLKALLGLDDRFEVVFFGGGATTQFSLLPMNALREDTVGNYVETGAWAAKAVNAARAQGRVHIAASSADGGKPHRYIPRLGDIALSARPAYLHLTSNNTIFGTQWSDFPAASDVPLVADMSSDLLWRPFDASRFSLIYAGAQKNLGPAGVTVAIVRRDFLARLREDLPALFSYRAQVAKNSLNNTPPCFAVYLMGKTLAWIESLGGLSAIEARNRAKAKLVYDALDAHADFYQAPVARDSRSVMNLVFTLPNDELQARFVAEAAGHQMVGLKGHRSVGGIRVSLYNAAPLAWAEAVADFIAGFAHAHGKSPGRTQGKSPGRTSAEPARINEDHAPAVDVDHGKDKDQQGMSKFSGTIRRNDLEGGAWTLITDVGTVYQLKGGDGGLLRDGARAEVQGSVARSTMGIAMVGEILEVRSYKLVD